MATTMYTLTQAAGTSTKKFTVSMWLKPGTISTNRGLWGCGTGTGDGISLKLGTDDTISFESWNGSVNPKQVTDRVFRDPAAWYHLVFSMDTTDVTAGDRSKIWINGVEIVDFSTDINPVLDSVIPGWSGSGDTMKIGNRVLDGDAFDTGLMSHVHIVDGTIYGASTFGETDSTSGIWKIKTSPTVTYGTNGGFYKFESGALTTDSSGEGNTLTQVGSPTETKDNPSNNFATLNPVDNYYPASTFSNGNNTIVTVASKYAPNLSTLGISAGKWYWEVKPTTGSTDYMIGVSSTQTTSDTFELGNYPNDYGYAGASGIVRSNDANTAYGDTYTTNDIIGVALDLDNNKLYFSKNGTFQDSGVPTSGATGTGAISITAPASTVIGSYFAAQTYWTSSTGTFNYNFGNGYFGTTAVPNIVL